MASCWNWKIMLPHAMVKLVMSVHGEHAIGFS